eukprot:5383890-Lingulodinium_polyedra.AAC.1
MLKSLLQPIQRLPEENGKEDLPLLALETAIAEELQRPVDLLAERDLEIGLALAPGPRRWHAAKSPVENAQENP